jgi:hypothetical protein
MLGWRVGLTARGDGSSDRQAWENLERGERQAP